MTKPLEPRRIGGCAECYEQRWLEPTLLGYYVCRVCALAMWGFATCPVCSSRLTAQRGAECPCGGLME